jgi:hypothetical protein
MDRKATVTCYLYTDGQKCARGKVVAVRVPSWPGQETCDTE